MKVIKKLSDERITKILRDTWFKITKEHHPTWKNPECTRCNRCLIVWGNRATSIITDNICSMFTGLYTGGKV